MADSNELHPSKWSKFLALTQAGPTRRRWTAIGIGLGDVVPVIAAVLSLVAVSRGSTTSTPWLVGIGVGLAAFVAFTKVLKYGLDLREKGLKRTLGIEMSELRETLAQEAVEAAERAGLRVFAHWKRVARYHEDGMENAHRQLQEVIQIRAGERVGAEAIDSCLKAIGATFEAFYEGQGGTFTINLMVPNAGRTQLWLVRIEPGGEGRSNNLPRPYAIDNEQWGATTAFRDNTLLYTEDVRRHGNAGDRGYLSVVNMPVHGVRGEIVAMVNVDSPLVGAFGSVDLVKDAASYCRDIRASLALCLADVRLFSEQRG